MSTMNYMQRVGHSSCIRCDFETSDDMSFAEQDAAMMAHLAEKHPDWMTDGGASILKRRMPGNEFPLYLYPSFTLNGAGRGVAHSEQELMTLLKQALDLSPTRECLITGSPLKEGQTVHEPGCDCGFCKMGDTRL